LRIGIMQTAAMKKNGRWSLPGRAAVDIERINSRVRPQVCPANVQPDNGSKRGNNPHFEAGKLPALKGEVHEHREQRSASSNPTAGAGLSGRRQRRGMSTQKGKY